MNYKDILNQTDQIQITRLINKKELIADLKAIPTENVEICFTKDSRQVIIKQPRGLKFINHIARN